MKLLAVDLISALLTMLMALLAYLIVRNSMESANGLVMIYAVLCILNFVFDLVPLIMSLHGRTSVSDGRTERALGPGIEKVEVTRVFRTTNFFDDKLGFRYNVQSCTLILSPICMLLGAYLSLKAV